MPSRSRSTANALSARSTSAIPTDSAQRRRSRSKAAAPRTVISSPRSLIVRSFRRASTDGVTHHHAHVNGTTLHYVRAGESGTPILLVHGFPESWWAFHKVIPLLAREHRVYAVDLRGFGDSAIAEKDHSSSVAAQDLHELIRHLDVGPVVVAGQDIAGGALYRLAHMHAEDVSALVAVEMGLAGFGLEGSPT